MPPSMTVCRPASSLIVRSLMAFNVGASFTGFTVTLKLCIVTLFEPAPSLIATVSVAVPFALVTGRKLKVPVLAGLLYETVGVGINVRSLELAVTVRTWFSF